MKIQITNAQTKRRIQPQNIKNFASWLIELLQKKKRFPAGNELSIVITDDSGIEKVHQQFLGKKGSTDVISFNYHALPGEKTTVAGEIIVNIERAFRHRTPSWELALYLAHGLDHLCGESDHTARLQQRMRRRELGWLREAKKQKTIGRLVYD